MFKKDPERYHLVTEKQDNMYTLSLGSMASENLEKGLCGKTDLHYNHCHDKSRALEDREREKKQARRRLYIVSVVCLIFMIGEIAGGYFAGSLAVMTDAAHLLVDFTSFMISLCSLWLSSRPASKKLNYGWHRAEILGALLSVFTIWLVTGVLVYLACERLLTGDYTIEGNVMLITSGCAVVANIIMGLTLHQSGHGHSHGDSEPRANASVRAAFVHVVGDLLQSVSVLVSAVIIFFKVRVEMLSTPAGVDYNTVRDRIVTVKGVKAIHNLHIWALTMNQVVLSAHVAIDGTVDPQLTLKEITQTCFDSFNCHSVTIQVEQHSDQKPDCVLCQDPQN
ncbi:ZNT8 protein, partial [Atractosteus spatula]|nr:ZNT8 protein [Atractosteus spatula]